MPALKPFMLARVVALALFAAPAGIAHGQQGVTDPASAPAPHVRPAIDGILDAFKTHPLVGLSGAHGMAQVEDFYAAVVRDPRFARDVGNVVVEFGNALHQPIVDRYLAGEDVPYTELRKVWSDAAGFAPGALSLGYAYFYAQVRATNRSLPPHQRIRVWLGDAPVDWTKVRTTAELDVAISNRDRVAIRVITEEILAKNQKALVIYGGAHLEPANRDLLAWLAQDNGEPVRPAEAVNMRDAAEERRRGAFFIINTYAGLSNRACTQAFEQTAGSWPVPALVTPVRGSTLEAELRRPGCASGARLMLSADIPQAIRERELADNELRAMGLTSHGLLYLGPAESLTQSPDMQDIVLDPEFQKEFSRRYQLFNRQQPYVRMTGRASPAKQRNYDAPPPAPALTAEQRLAAFAANDQDRDGKLDKVEYHALLKTLGAGDQLDSLFIQRDTDRDYRISAEEFRGPAPSQAGGR